MCVESLYLSHNASRTGEVCLQDFVLIPKRHASELVENHEEMLTDLYMYTHIDTHTYTHNIYKNYGLLNGINQIISL